MILNKMRNMVRFNLKYYYSFILASLCSFWAFGQDIYTPDTIRLLNPSFEGYPRHSMPPQGWRDCGFPNETPPDVQPFRATTTARWGQNMSSDSVKRQLEAKDGRTYLGMVVRDNDTWERVSQRLVKPLNGGDCYELELYICRSEVYISQSRSTGKQVFYNEPAVLRIWGGYGMCGRTEMLAESGPIDNVTWNKVKFELRPNRTYRYLMLEAFYKTPVLIPYNGNILLDGVSEIRRIPCPDEIIEEEVVAEEEEVVEEIEEVAVAATTTIEEEPKETVVLSPPKEKVIKDLDAEKVKVGQTFKIERLQFKPDSDIINDEAEPVLDEIAYFLLTHPDVKVEIGGHASYNPMSSKSFDKTYFEELSLDRAKSVAYYMYKKGVSKDQVSFFGYGINEPIASNYSSTGRAKNQRVEIKITEIN